MITDLLSYTDDMSDILMGLGMHCLGCSSSRFETLRDAAEVHGYDSDDLADELNELLMSCF